MITQCSLEKEKTTLRGVIRCNSSYLLRKIKNDLSHQMCFSPSVSFGASAVLGTVGVISFACSRTTPQKVLSGIPLLFAIQQFMEGVLWLSLLHPSWAQWEKPAMYGFLVFAQMVWPIYVPLSILLFENNPLRRRLISMLTLIGIGLAGYLGFCLYYYPVSVMAGMHHIKYEFGFALANKWYFGLLYFLPTILSPLFSSRKPLHWLGYLFLASYVLARLLLFYFIISVWCFFGAVISISVLVMILKFRKEIKTKPDQTPC